MEALFLIAEEIDAIEAPFLLHAIEQLDKRRKRKVAKIAKHVDEVVSLADFTSNFRLSPSQVEDLIRDLHPFYMNSRGTKWPIRETVLACLWALATQESYRTVADRFNTSKSLICTHLHEVCSLISAHLANRISWPKGQAVHEIEQGFLAAGFPRTLSAVGSCQIPIAKPQNVENPDSYFNMRRSYSVNLMAFCDDKARFVHVNVGHPGGWPDAQVFSMTDIARGLREDPLSLLPEGMHIVGSAAYPLSQHLMTPYLDMGHLTDQQKKYNQNLSSARMVIEKAFFLLKDKFRRLKGVHMHDVHNISTAVSACCVLHNICLDATEDFQFEVVSKDAVESDDLNVPQDPSGIEKRNTICASL